MNKALDTLCYIQEQTSFEEDYSENFGYTIHKTDDPSRFFLTFEGILQSFGIQNRNGREYVADNIMNCINTDEQIQHALKTNSWIGEMDHPSAKKVGEELTVQRIANPDPERSSHFIRRPRLENNLLIAPIQTDSSNKAGMNLAIKIIDGKIVPCFSARVLGALDTSLGKKIVKVRKLITYDWVLFPSHREAMAKITQPIQENVIAMEKCMKTKIIPFPQLVKLAAGAEDVKFLCESFELTEEDFIGVTETGNSAVFNENGNIYVQPLNDTNIRNKTISALRDILK